jgi:hypothetical protein
MTTLDPEVQRKFDAIARFIAWWLRATDEARITITRIAIEQERLEQLAERKPADAQTAVADAQA